MKFTGTENLDYFITKYQYDQRDLQIPDTFSGQYLYKILKKDALVFFDENLKNCRSRQKSVEMLKDEFKPP